ncbi:tRNA (adenosine(37)-N6)-dimethylallyltransferase MiaA [Endothiovibrio diazotrophicus]
MGPTASGKTDLAVALARELPCELISVDSALVYRGMDIGTAKPESAVLAEAPHRLIDILDPAEAYSAARFRDDALREMTGITAAGRIPLLVGGTMLYYRALTEGLSAMPSADPAVRERLDAEERSVGLAELHRRLAAVDSASGERIHPNDPQRIKRALELIELTGRTPSELYAEQRTNRPPYRWLRAALTPADRGVLHQRIERRFDLMLEQGFVEEVEGLRARGDLSLELPSMRAVGYRQVWEYLDGRLDRAEMRERGIVATRQLAKRQFTWLRSTPATEWFDPSHGRVAERLLGWLNQSGIS